MCPIYVNFVMVSDASRFTMAFGATPYSGGYNHHRQLDPMLIRWTDQESVGEVDSLKQQIKQDSYSSVTWL
jgi:hypothetical protein